MARPLGRTSDQLPAERSFSFTYEELHRIENALNYALEFHSWATSDIERKIAASIRAELERTRTMRRADDLPLLSQEDSWRYATRVGHYC